MKTRTKRGFFAKAGALLAIAALAISASPVQALDAVTGMPEASGVVITKLEQPDIAGDAASGEIQEGLTGAIKDVKFEAYEVLLDGFTKGTNEWQKEIATTTLDDQQVVSAGSGTAARTGTTGDDGKIIWDTGVEGNQGDALDRGLYLVRETETPEGVIPAADFLLAVPLTNPSPLTPPGWLETIYVYPKSSQVTATMSVENATDYSVGDTVTWTINAKIPQIRDNANGDFLSTDFFAITDTFTKAELAPGVVTVKLGETVLSESVGEGTGDYTLDTVPNGDDTTTTVTINFTTAGREKMAQALRDSTAKKVTATINTEVKSIGEITNVATIHPSGALDGETSFKTNDAMVKYGQQPVSVKDSTGVGVAVSGAQFRVYLTEKGAKERNADPYDATDNADGYLTTTTSSTEEDKGGIFTTGAEGTVDLGGFRYSNFADNDTADQEQIYWFAQVKAESGQQLLAAPVSFTITDDTKEKEIILSANANGFTLPLTGGTGTTLLTILGLGILAIVLFVARSRRNAEA